MPIEWIITTRVRLRTESGLLLPSVHAIVSSAHGVPSCCLTSGPETTLSFPEVPSVARRGVGITDHIGRAFVSCVTILTTSIPLLVSL